MIRTKSLHTSIFGDIPSNGGGDPRGGWQRARAQGGDCPGPSEDATPKRSPAAKLLPCLKRKDGATPQQFVDQLARPARSARPRARRAPVQVRAEHRRRSAVARRRGLRPLRRAALRDRGRVHGADGSAFAGAESGVQDDTAKLVAAGRCEAGRSVACRGRPRLARDIAQDAASPPRSLQRCGRHSVSNVLRGSPDCLMIDCSVPTGISV